MELNDELAAAMHATSGRVDLQELAGTGLRRNAGRLFLFRPRLQPRLQPRLEPNHTESVLQPSQIPVHDDEKKPCNSTVSGPELRIYEPPGALGKGRVDRWCICLLIYQAVKADIHFASYRFIQQGNDLWEESDWEVH